jgi:hypothetical protein
MIVQGLWLMERLPFAGSAPANQPVLVFRSRKIIATEVFLECEKYAINEPATIIVG